ncbi:galactose-3-O-sulfotransferase 2-like [Mercenaria mercenaria]|uniref:galactose-3-O-sulfotransferase 2-like n=1 Tax=Mercenaria mercenaria TaxID=6596 RepID=UPI001E1D55CF|nr:galactose-3-O-sulfotransferase 2-like [Mercenaria mercenaria]
MPRLWRGFLILLVLISIQMRLYINRLNRVCSDASHVPRNECFVKSIRNKLETTHVAFLKIHKTASTTVQNIFLRFGQSRNLTFILAHDKADLAEIDYLPNVISVNKSLTEKNIVPPPSGKHYDMLCCHVIYNRDSFDRYLPQDTFYIGLVREPIERLESAFAFFGHLKSTNLSEYAKTPYLYHHYVGSMTNNRMSFAFGFPLNLFLKNNSSNVTERDKQSVKDFLVRIRSEFDLILIHERLNHSIILMKRMMNWHIRDVIYISRFSRSRHKRTFLQSEKQSIKSYLYLDYLLYDFALKEFNRKVDRMSDDFHEEVNHFAQLVETVSLFCHAETMMSMHIPSSKWDGYFNVTKTDCDLYKKSEIGFIREIRMRQYGRLNI